MTSNACRPLIEVLTEIPDFRKNQGKRHPLAAILALCCVAYMCGYRSYGAMAEWGRNYGQELARQLGFPNGKTPSVGTLHTIFRFLDKEALELHLGRWAEEILGSHQSPPEQTCSEDKPALLAIAIDGKTLRGSKKQGAFDVHLLSAVSHGLGLTLFQQAVDDKTNEIPAIQEVLKCLVVEGRVVTVDALLTQKEIAKTILEKKGTM